MLRSLPPKPNLRFLQLQVKGLLQAQRHANAAACPTLRLLDRFRNAGDEEILGAKVMLHEAQFALALSYGFKSWPDLRRHLQTLVEVTDHSLDAVHLGTPEEIPEYAAAGVPLATVAALHRAGENVDFIDLAAGSGWAFSFGYRYDDISPAFLAVRGRPGRDGPFEVFAFLPERLGYRYESARTQVLDELWPFVVRHVDAGTPIISERLDGGLITAYRGDGPDRAVLFDGPVGAGWVPVGELQPYAVYVLQRDGQPQPTRQIDAEALRRAVAKAAPHTWRGVPQGLAALEAYLVDVADPNKAFAETPEWFCWAAFERLTARKCCALWLRRLAERFGAPARKPLRAAADHYAAAYEQYEQYRRAVTAGEPTREDLLHRARTPARIAAILPLLTAGIEEETRGLEQLQAAADQTAD
ncbi:MAG: hypothetical protein PVJ57_08345 [Phycisphaerae bacterium]